jgi:predicted O-methyltransferase YrrM
MLQKILSYIKYLIKAQTKYSIHSPFVFDLITLCIEKPTNKLHFSHFDAYKKSLLLSNDYLMVNDFGAGSKVFKSNNRKIKDIAKIAGMSSKKAKLILKLVDYFQPKSILEIGTSLGIGTSTFSIAAPVSKIFSLEGCAQTAQKADYYLKLNHLDNIKIEIGEFSKSLPKILDNQNFELIYFDGNHQKKATLEYFNLCINSIQNNSLFIFDDIHWTDEMEQAWKEIHTNSRVTVSIDLYYIGLVFFRKESIKQHFIIRS